MKKYPHFKLAIFNAFFSVKGGAERFVIDLRNHFEADLFAGAINFKYFNPKSNDTYSQELFDPKYKLIYLHKDIEVPLIRLLKRYLFFLFSPKIKKLLEYDAVVFSGNVMFVQRRIKKLRDRLSSSSKPKLIMYCHTTPRKFTDQFESFYNSAPKGFKNLFKLFGYSYMREYIKDMRQMDVIIANSENTRNRILKYTGLDSKVFFGAVDTAKFKYISYGDFFLSYARLEEMKRIPLILEVFSRLRNKKLVICSTGPLQNWVENQIKIKQLSNISFEGFVSAERLRELIGKCYAGIYIPVDEDLGLTQIEFMAAGKPVIGVKEGGLLETIIDGETGILIPSNPTVEDLIKAIDNFTPGRVSSMKEKCIEQARKFDAKVFFERWEKEFNLIME